MNRRTFVLAFAAACRGGPRAAQSPPRRRTSPSTTTGFSESPPPLWEQIAPSPLATGNDLIAQRTESELRMWDSRTLTPLCRVPGRYQGQCFLPDGRLIAYKREPTGGELSVLARTGAVTPLAGPTIAFDETSRLLPAAAPGDVYATTRAARRAIRYTIATDSVREIARVDLPPQASEAAPIASLGDGRLVTSHLNVLRVVEPGQAVLEYGVPGSFPFHLARGSRGRIWYSSARVERLAQLDDVPPQDLVLASFGSTLTTDARIAFAPGRIIHMDAAPDGRLVALLWTAPPGERRSMAIVVLDDDGHERWRLEPPAAMNISDTSWVAMSDDRVVVMRKDETLFAWDAATGRRVG